MKARSYTQAGVHLGVMIFRDTYRKENILRKFVTNERLDDYVSDINRLKEEGWEILAIVCDGKRGLFKAFGKIPIQNVSIPSNTHSNQVYYQKSNA